MWVDTRDHDPSDDGIYLIQYVTGEKGAMQFTVAGGWNTHYESTGNLYDEAAIKDGYVVRWYSAPEPPMHIPEEWRKEWLEAKI